MYTYDYVTLIDKKKCFKSNTEIHKFTIISEFRCGECARIQTQKQPRFVYKHDSQHQLQSFPRYQFSVLIKERYRQVHQFSSNIER